MDTSPQVIKIDEVHGITVGDARMGRHAVVARKHGLGHTEHRDRRRYESSAHDWCGMYVAASRITGWERSVLFPLADDIVSLSGICNQLSRQGGLTKETHRPT